MQSSAPKRHGTQVGAPASRMAALTMSAFSRMRSIDLRIASFSFCSGVSSDEKKRGAAARWAARATRGMKRSAIFGSFFLCFRSYQKSRFVGNHLFKFRQIEASVFYST
jgi:hypothetical protein